MGSRAFSGPRGFTEQLGRGRVHGSAVIRMERIFNVAGIQVFGKIYPSMSSKLAAPDSNWNCDDTPRPRLGPFHRAVRVNSALKVVSP